MFLLLLFIRLDPCLKGGGAACLLHGHLDHPAGTDAAALSRVGPLGHARRRCAVRAGGHQQPCLLTTASIWRVPQNNSLSTLSFFFFVVVVVVVVRFRKLYVSFLFATDDLAPGGAG
jgi:hypothetical protein